MMSVVVIVISFRSSNVFLLFSPRIGKFFSFFLVRVSSFSILLQCFFKYTSILHCVFAQVCHRQFSFHHILSRFLISVIGFSSMLNSQYFYLSIHFTESICISLFVTLRSYFPFYVTFSLCRSSYPSFLSLSPTLFLFFCLFFCISRFIYLFQSPICFSFSFCFSFFITHSSLLSVLLPLLSMYLAFSVPVFVLQTIFSLSSGSTLYMHLPSILLPFPTFFVIGSFHFNILLLVF